MSLLAVSVLGALGIVALVVLVLRETRLPAELERLRRREVCWHCGYDLRAGTKHRCPECGQPVAPYQCARCGHSLAGLRDHRCPECGDRVPESMLALVHDVPNHAGEPPNPPRDPSV